MPTVIQIGKCLLKLQLKMSGMFFETQCIDMVKMNHLVKYLERRSLESYCLGTHIAV